ncbi:MAG TPA: nuclear transport factor 2 family protein [Pyrinomonadaceae bacterium]|jgi:ketosteroid isomerase-like protein
MSDEEGVRAANARFYEAMNALDVDMMDALWADDVHAVCVHPGRDAIVGYERVRESWAMIFAVTASMSVAASDVQVTLAGEAAWVVCTETISLMVEGELLAASAQATNIFRRMGQEWRMLVHHASPIPLRDVTEEWPDVIN